MFPMTTGAKIGVTVMLALAGVIALHLGRMVFVPLLIALFLATVLGPAAAWLHRVSKFSWETCCIAVILGLVVVNLLIALIFSASIVKMAGELPNPRDEKKMIETYNKLRVRLEGVSPWSLDEVYFPRDPKSVGEIRILQNIVEWIPVQAIVTHVASYGSSWLWQLVLTLFITLFVLLEGKMLARRVVQIFGPSKEVQDAASGVLFEMAKQVNNYLVWRTLINLGLAIVMGVIFTIFGLSQPWTWAILLAILNYIPYVGPILACLPPLLDAFIYSGPASAIIVMILYIVVINVEGYLIVPLVMGRNMDLNATTVMMACLFWEMVWGPTGLFLAMPIMAGLKAILHHVPEWRVWANLMSSTDDDEPPAAAGKDDQPPPPVAAIPPAPGDSPNGKPGSPHIEERKPAAEHEPPRAGDAA